MRQEKSSSGKVGFLHDLKFNWVDGAELEGVAILGDAKADWRTRSIAADVLLDITGMKYYGEVYSAALEVPLEGQEHFATVLQTKQSPEWKARVVRFAFSVIQLQRTAYTDRLDHGYFIASALQGYVGAPFVPNQSDPKYKGENGLTAAFFIDTVENALKWWETNKGAYPQ